MSYKINFTDTISNPTGITVEDQSLNTADTDLVFVGKNFPGYSQYIGENFLHLLENFAKTTPPTNPVKGQLWYDTTLSKPQLKVFDGTTWTEAGNIKKSLVQPSVSNSVAGDLWVDTTSQQLYLFTGPPANVWVLVGPQFSSTSTSGVRAESILDRATNTEKIVISYFVDDERVAITSKYEFTPKITLEGFPIIYQGITLSNKDFDLDGTIRTKFWGTSEKSDSLVVGSQTVPASNFLRGDVVSTTNYTLNVRNQSGINIGQSLETSITSSSAGTIINQTTPDSTIKLRLNDTINGSSDIVIVTASGKVGINKNPNETLDVSGNFLNSGSIKTTNTEDSTSLVTGSIQTLGGVAVTKSLTVGNNASIQNQLTVGPNSTTPVTVISPRVNNVFDIGRYNTTNPADPTNLRFRNIYAQNLVADTISGTFVGTLSGSVSGTASQLQSSQPVSIVGDVVSNTVLFNGTTAVNLSTVINNTVITNRLEVEDSFETDEFLLYRSGVGLRKTNRTRLFSSLGTIPIGGIMPYAGDTAPNGYLFCDGSEQSRSFYSDLFSVVGFKYKAEGLLTGFQTFALPDLRGRFPVGRDGMDNANTINVQTVATNVDRLTVFAGAITATFIVSSSNILPNFTTYPFQPGRIITGTGLDVSASPAVIASVQNNTPAVGQVTIIVTVSPQPAIPSATGLTLQSIGLFDAGGGNLSVPRIPGANTLGNVGGLSEQTLAINQLPQHSHTLQGSSGNQYYAVRLSGGVPSDTGAITGSIHQAYGETQLLPTTGNINTTSSVGQPVSVVNPYQTLNYIIFTGRTL
jgi:microcystin-dependent protein